MANSFIPQTDPKAAYLAQRAEIDAAISRVLAGGFYILGEETAALEREFAAAVGCQYGIGVGSGTDAIVLALRGLGIGQGKIVATVSNTAVATVAAIEIVGATALLIDIDPRTYTMEPQALERALAAAARAGKPVAAILPVHLYGQAADLAAMLPLAREYDAALIEDCAQAHGATFAGRPVGSYGNAAAFSFYPTKNLGALGDAGLVTTQSEHLAIELKAIRQYGWRDGRRVSASQGINSRLDELQAAVLRAKLPRLGADNDRRRQIAARYDSGLADLPVSRPFRDPRCSHVFHQYVIRCVDRDALRVALKGAGIATNIHYPVPVHLQPAYRDRLSVGPGGLLNTEQAALEILSLPMYPQLSDAEVDRVIEAIRTWAMGNDAVAPARGKIEA